MTAKDFAIGVLVDTLNFTTEEASALFDADGNAVDDALDAAKTKRASQVDADKAARKKVAEEQKNAGMRQKGEWYEKQIKAIGIDLGDATGEEAIEKIKAHLETVGTQSKGVDPKDEQSIRNSKVFRDEQLAMAKKHADLVKEYEAKLTGVQTDFQRKETLRAVRDDIKATIKELNAVLPEDPKLLEKQMRLVDLDLEGVQFERDGDTWTLKDKEGNVIENAQGHAIKYQDFLKDTVRNNYPIAASGQKTSAGDITKGSKTTGGGIKALNKPANDDEYAAQMHKIRTETTDRVERQKLLTQLEEVYHGKAEV